tara:strand:- start:25 stop:294 length:270 start_codon:yes stop_codon:yes gene_type:complete
MKHTKGKWSVVTYDGDKFRVQQNFKTIAWVNALEEIQVSEGMANAKLVASAPDMLEVLKKLEDVFDRMRWGKTKYLDIIQKVIARAEVK